MNEKALKFPKSWKEIKLSNFEKWYMMTPTNTVEMIALVSFILDVDQKRILDMPIEAFNDVVDRLGFIKELPKGIKSEIVIDGTKYLIDTANKMTTAEYVDVDTLFERDEPNKLSMALAILCRKEKEVYDSDKVDERQKMFANMPMDVVYPLVAFFLSKGESYRTLSVSYSHAQASAQQRVKDIKTLVTNMDGTRPLTIWQKIRFTAMMVYLKYLLKKSLYIKDIALTKQSQKSNNTNI